MISLAYVNGNQELELNDILSLAAESFIEATETIMNDIDEAYKEYCESCKYIEAELFVMEAVDDKKKEDLNKNRAGFISKLGQAIIDLFKKFMAAADNIITDIKGRISGDTKKIEYLCKKDPTIADKIRGMAQRGEITLKDAKDFKDLDKLYEDLMKSTEDPNTLKSRWRKGVEKLENKKGVLFAVAAGAAAIGAIVKFGPDVMKANNDLKESARKQNEDFDRTYGSFKSEWSKENPGKDFSEENGKFQTKLAIHRELLGLKSAAMGKNQSSFQKLASMAAKTADKVTDKVTKGKASDNFHAAHSYNASKIKEADDKKKQDEIDESNRRAEFSQELRNKADLEKEKRQAVARKKEREEERNQRIKDELDKEKRQAAARKAEKDANNAKKADEAFDTEYAKLQARDKYNEDYPKKSTQTK